MHPTSSAQKENILSLASNGFSNHHIASKLGVGRSSVARTLHDLLPNHHTPLTGHPSKLSSTDQHAFITQIKTGKASNAVQAMKHINTIISHPISSQTIRRVLKKHSFKAVVKKKKPLLHAKHIKARLAFAQKYREGLWRTGRGLFHQMRPKATGLGQMEESGCGSRLERGLLRGRCREQSSLVEETSWYGAVWGGMEWAILQRLRGRWMLTSMCPFWRTTCCLAWMSVGFLRRR